VGEDQEERSHLQGWLMNALAIIIAYGNLAPEEQEQVSTILMVNAVTKRALGVAQKELEQLYSGVRENMGTEAKEDNVVHGVFGMPKKENRGRKASPISALSLARKFLLLHTKGTVDEILVFCQSQNPRISRGNLYSAGTVLHKEGAITREYGCWSRAA
jgi:hypothetical protein